MAVSYRAEHVGSFLRPRALLDARADPSITHDELRRLEDARILEVLDRQRALGFRIFSDGELRRQGFMSDFYESVDGLDRDGSVARAWQGESRSTASGVPISKLTGLVIDRLRQTRRLAKHESSFLADHSPGPFKVTLPTANQFPAICYRKGLSDAAYPTYSDFLWDVVPIIKSEIDALVAEGVSYIQLDAPRYSYYLDPKWREHIRTEMGVSPEDALDEAIRVDNTCLRDARRAGVTLAIHLCRGNNRSQWYAEGGYDPIAERIFNELDADLFLLEYESARAGTFEPLRFVPATKGVVLGLVSSKVPELEPEHHLTQRIDAASRYVPLENLALSPQCGFASTLDGNLLSEEEQWRKMALVASTARRVWGTT
jgi:5-methyltetrahydropteroyltriglutamate--homocysteine methyltransferase